MNLSGKTALVTGAGTGIGKGIAVALAKRGANVAIHYNSSDTGARETQQQIDACSGQSMIVQANIAYKPEIEHMVNVVGNRFGGIDILVNNAALQLNVDFFAYMDDQFDQLMHINLKGYWQCIQAVVPQMKANGFGRIINISSVHGKRPTDFDVIYCMTKGGIHMLGRESAIELAKYGITVNTIEPGAVDVGKQGKLKRGVNRKKFPMGRVGLPSDIASMACYIASEESEFMTGASIRLDGGSMLL
ncbi:SDR family NAD(P)-dependent oxidoreductase [Paenibacillus sp. GCM10023248]|uniref:SDR family NAD(P)-dependent oxidoreductase n=1 Tax=unclassified Paenibacillus TaxID=185978 RepID=UPI0023790A7D|nr:SDR family oxidoreductase [Paenibacillus sp. MAHUQ-63]MDD9268541.1 SDR family NAD(P)-dependent oxidoreductase [Paenibacillus sp. MAHUQ-63]